jgi:DNA-directed RNA polymerase subunit RPC12/RpoP
METEICNECGRSVKAGSKLFINRIPDFNNYETKLEMSKPYPEGEYICAECDEKLSEIKDA